MLMPPCELESGGRSFTGFGRVSIWSRSHHSAVHGERDWRGVVLNLRLHTVLNVALRLAVLSLNILKHHCFSSGKTSPGSHRFCAIVLYYLENFFFFPRFPIAIHIQISVFLGLKIICT